MYWPSVFTHNSLKSIDMYYVDYVVEENQSNGFGVNNDIFKYFRKLYIINDTNDRLQTSSVSQNSGWLLVNGYCPWGETGLTSSCHLEY